MSGLALRPFLRVPSQSGVLATLHRFLGSFPRLHVPRALALPPASSCWPSPGSAPPACSADAQRIGFSHSAKTLVSMHEWVQRPELGERPLVFVVGAFAHGKIDDSYVDEYISISQVRPGDREQHAVHAQQRRVHESASQLGAGRGLEGGQRVRPLLRGSTGILWERPAIEQLRPCHGKPLTCASAACLISLCCSFRCPLPTRCAASPLR